MSVRDIIIKILAANHASDIFAKDEDVKKAYHSYVKLIHPDVCDDPLAQEAFVTLKEYYEYALEHPDALDKQYFMTGQKILLRKALDIQAFELGARYVCDREVVYIFDSGKDKYYENYTKQISDTVKGHIKDQRILKTYMPVIPRFGDKGKIGMGRMIIGIDKPPDEYPLDLFLKAYKDELSGRDIAWMISRMIDLCCFLAYASIPVALNGFTESNLFINPARHSIHIYGGWWYATPIGEKMIGTSKEVYSCMDYKTRTDHISSPVTDMECVRGIARRIVEGNVDIQKYMLDWINAGSLERPLEEEARWNEVLDKCYGPRKFIKFQKVEPNKIYTQKRS